jgi:hypothetical protein
MGKTRKSDNSGYWVDYAAIVPFRFDFVPRGTGALGSDVTVRQEQSALMEDIRDEAGQGYAYEVLLDIPWLAPKVRTAIMNELGRSQRAQNEAIEYARTVTLRHLVEETAARMRANGERPRGGVHEAAITTVAANAGMDAQTLKQRFKRLKGR